MCSEEALEILKVQGRVSRRCGVTAALPRLIRCSAGAGSTKDPKVHSEAKLKGTPGRASRFRRRKKLLPYVEKAIPPASIKVSQSSRNDQFTADKDPRIKCIIVFDNGLQAPQSKVLLEL
mmetsp:Transcript_41158/g.128468  ORF Transcript_41158/g.128468 Transcript_41158/m.128468 type:complete len:120 (+) Transcript_41158:1117-1476(+)